MGQTIYFAYGANIDRDHMARACPASQCLGSATLLNRRLVINERGWATVLPCQDDCVHGALWLLTSHCEATLDLQEDVHGGLYYKQAVDVRDSSGNTVPCMAYIATSSGLGMPNPGYLERIVAWAESWEFPLSYRQALASLHDG